MPKTDWKSFISTAQTLNEELTLNEGPVWDEVTDFCKYIEMYIFGVALVVVLFIAWLFTATIVRPIAAIARFVGFMPEAVSIAIEEFRKTYKIYQTQKELTPEEIARVKNAAQAVYDAFGPRAKAFITKSSKQLSRIDLSTPQGKQQATSIVMQLKDLVQAAEVKQKVKQNPNV